MEQKSYTQVCLESIIDWYKKRKKVIKVDWKLFISAIAIMGFFVFAGAYLKYNLINKDLGTILLIGVPMIGGMFAGNILYNTFSMEWILKDKNERRKVRNR